MGYYVWLQINQIAPYWLVGLFVGAVAGACHQSLGEYIPLEALGRRETIAGFVLAAFTGAVSPITIYGALPILAVLSHMGVRQSTVTAFVVTSILINPNVFIFTFALGAQTALLRLMLSLAAGIAAGLLVRIVFRGRGIYDFSGFSCEQPEAGVRAPRKRKIAANFCKAVRRTAPNLATGILLAALFQQFFPKELFRYIFGSGNGLSVLFAASLGATAYYCGGGTIPLIMVWMKEGMSPGAAMAFMLTGPAVKLTNLTAVKAIMPFKGFVQYLLFSVAYGTAAGLLLDLIYRFSL